MNVLRNILPFNNMLAGAQTVQAHGLHIEGLGIIPDLVWVDNPLFVIVAVTDTNVTLRNDGPNGNCNVYVEYWHSVDRLSPGLAALSPRPFQPSAQGMAVGDVGIFGDGSDGDVTLAVPLTLTRDMFYNNLITNGQDIDCDGFRIFCRNLCVIGLGSVVHNDGTDGAAGAGGVGGAGGAACVAGSLGGSVAGGAGGNGGAVGVAGTAIADSYGGTSGAGGAGTNAGGALGAATAPAATTLPPRTLPTAVTMVGIETAGAQDDFLGGAGGGGGGAAAVLAGGGGGGGAGVVMICARRLTLDILSSITANGGDGGASQGLDAGGGGGGGGGVISLVYQTAQLNGTLTANGGAGGAGDGGAGVGADGNPGLAGTVFQLQVRI